MTSKLTLNKRKKIFTFCEEVAKSKVHSIRKIASLLGNINVSFEVLSLGPLHYRNIEHCVIVAFKVAKGNFECKMSVSPEVKIQVAWWKDNIYTRYRSLEEMPINDAVYTDPSSHG